MNPKYNHASTALIVILTVLSICMASCTTQPTQAPTISATRTTSPIPLPTHPTTPTSTVTSVPMPKYTLDPDDFYFSLDGKPTFFLSRNPTGKTQADFDTVLDWAHQGGSKVIRVHLTHGWWGDPWINPDWSVNEKWAQDWDRFFDQAQADGIYVLPVFGVWADWNNGKPDYGSPLWQYNPLNQANGGPVSTPDQLFQSGSDTQDHWMEWVKALVERWQGRENIIAWEIFSEINIASGIPGKADAKGGVDEATGVDFTDKAMSVIHASDLQQRAVTISLAGVYAANDAWADYYQLDSLDFIEIHPYSDKLDRELIKEVREYTLKYQKPVLIGESGLWSMTHNQNASIGIEHAIWAGLVSGAMNGRALWDNDGYAIYSAPARADAIRFMQEYSMTELPVANFSAGVDFSGFQPLISKTSSGVWGAAVGNEKLVLGWYRDASSEPPNWNLKPLITKQTVAITVPGSAANWKIDFYDTSTGVDILSTTQATRKDDQIKIMLPDFTNDIAFKMVAVD